MEEARKLIVGEDEKYQPLLSLMVEKLEELTERQAKVFKELEEEVKKVPLGELAQLLEDYAERLNADPLFNTPAQSQEEHDALQKWRAIAQIIFACLQSCLPRPCGGPCGGQCGGDCGGCGGCGGCEHEPH